MCQLFTEPVRRDNRLRLRPRTAETRCCRISSTSPLRWAFRNLLAPSRRLRRRHWRWLRYYSAKRLALQQLRQQRRPQPLRRLCTSLRSCSSSPIFYLSGRRRDLQMRKGQTKSGQQLFAAEQKCYPSGQARPDRLIAERCLLIAEQARARIAPELASLRTTRDKSCCAYPLRLLCAEVTLF